MHATIRKNTLIIYKENSSKITNDRVPSQLLQQAQLLLKQHSQPIAFLHRTSPLSYQRSQQARAWSRLVQDWIGASTHIS